MTQAMIKVPENGKPENKAHNQNISSKHKNIREDKKQSNINNKYNQEDEVIKVGTWNLQGIYEEGAVLNLVQEAKRYKLDILAMQETHLKDNSIVEIEEYVLFTSGGTTRRFGTGFLVSKKMKGKVIKFQAISDRMCKLQVRDKHKNITMLNFHAPTEEKDDETKDEFYEQLEEIIDRIPITHVKIVIGDANAKIGNEDIFKSITGGESKHDRSNDNGLRIINMAIEKQMKIMSTHFKRKDIYKGTWIIPRNNETNQIDHVLIGEKDMKLIKNVRSYRGADANSDHFLVIVKLKLKQIDRTTTKRSRKRTLRYRMEELQQPQVARNYRYQIHKCLEHNAGTKLGQTIDDKILHIEKTIEIASKESLTMVKATKRKSWLDEKCIEEIKKKKRLREKYLQTRNERDKREYMKQRRAAKNICRSKKRQHEENKIKIIEEKYSRQEIRNFYKDVKEINKGYKPKTPYIQDKEGNLLGEKKEIMQRWKCHFEELLKVNSDVHQQDEEEERRVEDPEDGGDGGEVEEPTESETEEVIMIMKNNKSPGANNITAENLKYGGVEIKREVTKLIQEVWRTEMMPDAWKKAVLLPIYKKGDPTDCNNYRGIALLDIMYKILATLIKRRLEASSENIIGEYQCGFRKARATTDQIFLLKQVLTHCYEYEIPAFMLFIDFKAAYDTINRIQLLRALRKFKVPEKLCKLIDMTLTQTKNVIRIEGEESNEFEVTQGLRQGDPLSTLLFNIALESIIRNTEINRQGTLLNKSHQCLAYADDVVLIARKKDELKRIAKQLVLAAKEMGLEINESKSQYMKLENKKIMEEPETLQIELQNDYRIHIKETDNYMYLGVLINDKCDEEAEIDLRLAKANRCAGGLHKILKSKQVTRATKKRIYKTILRPTVLYGSETWVVNKKQQTKLEIWERKILRKIYGGKKTDDGWERRTNNEIYELYNDTAIINVIRSKRLQWLGHLERMERTRDVKEVAWKIPEGKKKKGRPRRKWKEAVMQDVAEQDIRDWKNIARDRDKWRRLTRL